MPSFPASVSLPWSLLGHCRITDVRPAGVQLQLGVSGVQTLGMCPPSNIDESLLPFLQLREGSGWLRAWLAYSTRSRRVRGVVPCFNLHIRDSLLDTLSNYGTKGSCQRASERAVVQSTTRVVVHTIIQDIATGPGMGDTRKDAVHREYKK